MGRFWIRDYRREWLRGDLLAGVTVAAYLVPQVMAYADVAGLPPVTGLYVMLGSLLVYAVLGTSRQLSVGPESTTALMTAAAVAPLAVGDPGRYAALAALLALLVGGMALVGFVARLGFLADLLSRPVLVGYMAGVAVLMIASQFAKVTGVPVTGDTPLAATISLASQLDRVHLPTLVLSCAMLTFLLVTSRLVPRAPVPLIGMLLATTAVALFSLTDIGIGVVGEIPAGLPAPHVPTVSLDDLTALFLPAAGIALVGYSDNVLTARAFAGRSGDRIDANRELLALGVANVAAGVLRGFPVSSSASRTVIGDALGSRTQLHSLVAVAVVTVTLLFGRPVLAVFPTAALGAIVIYAALRLIDVAEFRRIAGFRRSELLIALTAVVAVVLFGVLYGVVAAIALSVLDLLRKIARPHDGILGYVDGVPGMHDVDDYPTARRVPGLVVYRYDAPLCFANTEDFRRRALAAVDAAPEPVEWFVLNTEANVEIDITAADTLGSLHSELKRRGVVFALARLKQDVRAELASTGLLEAIGDDRIFLTLPTAVDAYLRSTGHALRRQGRDHPPW